MRRAVSSWAVALLGLGLLSGCGTGPEGTLGLAASSRTAIDLTQWSGGPRLLTGRTNGVTVTGGRAVFGTARASRTLGGTRYDAAAWISPWRSPGFDFTQLVASWSASTPGDSWIQVDVRGRSATGRLTSWDTLARWAAADTYVRRTSLGPQDDDGTTVDTDTWKTSGLRSYRLRVQLMRRHGTSLRPSLATVDAMTSALPTGAPATSRPGPGNGITLPVPRFSQMVHRGEFPQWGGGGEAWCSPTSTSMVLAYYGRGPKPSAYAWAKKYADPWVDHAARNTYDARYDGTGNWPFNTAYAAAHAGKAFVTRLRSLRQAGRFIAAGIPVIASIAFSRGGLSGVPISATHGHLVVIVGFTRSGDPVVNDPAAPNDRTVRRTYDRAQFERAWIDGSSGTAYIVHDAAHPLPAGSTGNW